MAVEDESFYNIVGDEVSRELLVNQMISYYYQKKELGETSVTDFNEGSEIRNMLEAFATLIYILMEDNYEVSKVAFIPTAYGEWLDSHGANPAIALTRNTGNEAVGVVTFTIPEPVNTETVIGEGTVIVSEETGLQYETESDCIIAAGETSNEVLIYCLTIGEDGNSAANTLTIIEDSDIDSSVSVTNSEAISGGTDLEDDETYRQRLLSFVRRDDFGSLPYYENLAKTVEGVHDVFINATESPVVIVVNGNEKPVSDNVLAMVLTEFTDTNNIILNHKFAVEKVTFTNIGGSSSTSLTVNINTEQEISEESIVALLNCIFDGGKTEEGFEFTGLDIGESLSYVTLETAFLNNFDVIESVEFEYNNAAFESLSPAVNNVLRLLTDYLTINQTVIGE